MDIQKMTAELETLKAKLLSISSEINSCVKQIDILSQQVIEATPVEIIEEKEVVDQQPMAKEAIAEIWIEEEEKAAEPIAHHEPKIANIEEPPVVNIPVPSPVKPKEAKANLNEVLAEKKEKTPVEHFADSPIADLKKAFSINQKLAYIKKIFNNDADIYNATIDELNNLSDFDAAHKLIQLKMSAEHTPEVLEEFLSFVKRRYI